MRCVRDIVWVKDDRELNATERREKMAESMVACIMRFIG